MTAPRPGARVLREAANFSECLGGPVPYVIRAGATFDQLVADAVVLMESAAGVLDLAKECGDAAHFAVRHLLAQARGLAGAVAALVQSGSDRTLAGPCSFFELQAHYEAPNGTSLAQLIRDAHILASCAKGVHEQRALGDDAEFAVMHLLNQAVGVLDAAAELVAAGPVGLTAR